MPKMDLDKRIFNSSGEGVKSWNQTKGHQAVTTQKSTRRGFDIQHQAYAYANLVNKLGEVNFFANVEARAELRAQAQNPINLFKESGLAIRLSAILKLAAAIGLSLDIKVRDLLEEVKKEQSSLLGRMTDIFFDEITLEGGLYGQAAFSAMAYANIVLTGAIITTKEVPEPSFQMVFDMGMGYVAGGGYRAVLDMDIDNPRRLLMRLTDVFIEEIIEKSEGKRGSQVLNAALKIGVRLSYEIGQGLAEQNSLSNEQLKQLAVNAFIQELQRWMIHQYTFYTFELFPSLPKNEAINNFLRTISNKTEDTKFLSIEDWNNILSSGENAITGLADESARKQWLQALAVVWSAAYIGKKMDAQIGETGAAFSFTGNLDSQPPSYIQTWIYNQLNLSPDTPLTIKSLFDLLMGDALHALIDEKREIWELFDTLYSPILLGTPKNAAHDIFTLGEAPPVQILDHAVPKFQALVSNYVSGPLTEEIKTALADQPEVRVLFEHFVLPTIEVANRVALREILEGFQGGFSREEVQEALSSVLLALIGSNIVNLTEATILLVQLQIGKALKQSDENITKIMDELKSQGAGESLEELKEFLQEAINIVGEHLGPFSQSQHQTIFTELKNVFTPMKDYSVQNFLEQLKNPDWVPQRKAIENIAGELAEILFHRLNTVSLSLLEGISKIVLGVIRKEIERLIGVFQENLNKWRAYLESQLRDKLLEQLTNLFLPAAKNALSLITLIPSIRELVERELPNSVRKGVEETILPIVLKAIREINFVPEPILDSFRNEPNLGAFRDSIISQFRDHLQNELRRVDLGFVLNVPISWTIPSLIPGQPPIRINRTIPIGFVRLPSDEIITDVVNTLTNLNPVVFYLFFEQMNQYALPVFEKEKEMAALQNQINSIREYLRGQTRNSYRITYHHSEPHITLQSIRNEHQESELELTIHYPNLLPQHSIFPVFHAIYLNNQLLPIQLFKMKKDEENRSHGLTLVGSIGYDQLIPGKNTLSTIIIDPFGFEYESEYPFLYRP